MLGTGNRTDRLLSLLVLAKCCRLHALWPFEVASTDGSTTGADAVRGVLVKAVVGKV